LALPSLPVLSLKKLLQPLPPAPALTWILAWSIHILRWNYAYSFSGENNLATDKREKSKIPSPAYVLAGGEFCTFLPDNDITGADVVSAVAFDT
jgi:hypothetical protein